MDVSKNSMLRKIPTTLFYEYVHELYVLFNHQNDIIYLSNICKLFIKIVNNVLFNYCEICHINDAVIFYLVKRRSNIVLSRKLRYYF